MTKYDEKFKLKVVKRYLSENKSYRALASEYKDVTYKSIYNWVTGYRLHGIKALKDHNGHSSYEPDFKLAVLKRMWLDGLTPFQVGNIFNIRGAHIIVSKWEQQYHSGGINALSLKPETSTIRMLCSTIPKRFRNKADTEKNKQELLLELEYMRTQVAYLKKLKALVQEK